MIGRGRRTEWEPFDDTERAHTLDLDDLDWPEPDIEIDDDEFARAIAAGRREQAAA